MKKIYKISIVLLSALMMVYSCKKEPTNNKQDNNNNNNPAPPTSTGNTPSTLVKGTDPDNAATQGFFLTNSWQAKTFTVPTAATTVPKPSAGENIYVSVDLSKIITKTSPLLFGNNTNPFMGQFVDQPALMSGITTLAPNILRFPGGSLSDIYFWNQSAQGPADAPAQLLDLNGTASAAGYWFGNNTQSWTFTLDNYYKVLQQTNSIGLITVNYGYARYGTSAHPDQAAAHLAAEWVRYDNGRTKYWEIGNENYGNWEAGYRINTSTNQDGQPLILTPTLYGTHFKVFADSMRAAAQQKGVTIKIGIVLTEANDNNTSSGNVAGWNAGVLAAAGNSPDFFVVHNYYTPYNQNSTPDVILNTPVSGTQSAMAWVKSSVQGANVTQKPVAMDEYNIFSTGSNQMVSQIAGVHGVMVLGEALKNQISMTARWDLANSWDNGDDMGMFSNSSNTSEAEPGAASWNPRPAFYYMYYFQHYFGDRMVSSTVTGNSNILSYASTFTSGQAADILVNKSSTDHTVTVLISNFLLGDNYYYYVLKGGPDATFSRKVVINGNVPSATSGGPADFTNIPPNSAAIKGGITVTVPAYGVVYLVADKSN
ncbi:alpha-L-arabinofuranosidase [Mucilaginibacter sp. McL0603]|uniref:alpha-L-arabinofuranosidase n=1 Tax=Mucilaginibacter sp. McL0603 TaxID=3415670 RepID=UPI003CF4C5E3